MFLYPAIAAGFALVAVPPLVHLINLLRHRRQQWAAMDFLLASYRRQRKWIRLRQFLLLLTRVALAALLVAMLAGWTGGGPVAKLIGGQTHHHIVVLDDSISMGAIGGGNDAGVGADGDAGVGGGQTTPYTRALAAIADLTARIAADGSPHQLTVIRTSRAALAVSTGSGSADSAADVVAVEITPGADPLKTLMATSPSTLATDPQSAIAMAVGLVDEIPADVTRIYVASDYRTRDWQSPDRIAASMAELPPEVEVKLIDCGGSDVSAANLAITGLSPQPDVWVAGVPVTMRMTIRNFSTRPANSIAPKTSVVRYDSPSSVDINAVHSGVSEDIPAAVIATIPPGGEVTRTFQVFVASPGVHAVSVTLPNDALQTDNRRVCTLPLSDAERVLVVDGSSDGRGGLAISSVLDPGSQVRVGAIPEVRPPSILRGITADELSTYRAVYLTDIDAIDASAAESLLQYVRRGGGLAMFIGPGASAEAYNSALADRGLLPGRLNRVSKLDRADDSPPDLAVGSSRSFITDPLRTAGTSAFDLVAINASWSLMPSGDAAVAGDANTGDWRELLVRRDGVPYALSRAIGEGNVVTVLSGPASSSDALGDWTNWSGDPTFVVFLLQSNAALYSGAAPSTHRLVTDQLVVAPESGEGSVPVTSAIYYRPVDSPPRSGIEVAATADGPPSVDPAGVLIDAGGSLDDFLAAGLGEWSYVDGEGGVVRPMASVIDPSDGDLSPVDPAAVLQSLPGVDASWVTAAVWSEQNSRRSGSTLTLVLLGLMAALLAVEQMLGYWASYHARPLTGRAAMTRSNATAGAAA